MLIARSAIVAFAILAAATAAASAVTARVSGPKAAAIMHERHEGMETIGKNFKLLTRELSRGSPDLAAVRTSAATVAGLSKKASNWFPAGAGPEAGKNRAQPENWQNPQEFAPQL